jgi:hypothetical protein
MFFENTSVYIVAIHHNSKRIAFNFQNATKILLCIGNEVILHTYVLNQSLQCLGPWDRKPEGVGKSWVEGPRRSWRNGKS